MLSSGCRIVTSIVITKTWILSGVQLIDNDDNDKYIKNNFLQISQ